MGVGRIVIRTYGLLFETMAVRDLRVYADALNGGVSSGIVDSSRQREVAFKMIVTATGDCAYQRKDGIVVCPMSCLRP